MSDKFNLRKMEMIISMTEESASSALIFLKTEKYDLKEFDKLVHPFITRGMYVPRVACSIKSSKDASMEEIGKEFDVIMPRYFDAYFDFCGRFSRSNQEYQDNPGKCILELMRGIGRIRKELHSLKSVVELEIGLCSLNGIECSCQGIPETEIEEGFKIISGHEGIKRIHQQLGITEMVSSLIGSSGVPLSDITGGSGELPPFGSEINCCPFCGTLLDPSPNTKDINIRYQLIDKRYPNGILISSIEPCKECIKMGYLLIETAMTDVNMKVASNKGNKLTLPLTGNMWFIPEEDLSFLLQELNIPSFIGVLKQAGIHSMVVSQALIDLLELPRSGRMSMKSFGKRE